MLFLENLSVTGSVRSAASAAQVSHQTAYRARRATSAFRTAWDAALVVARVSVADTVGCRAIDGITEPVFYHGEEVGSRTRFSDRLLLAHLARLDRLAETPAASAFANDWEAALGRFEAGEAQPEIAPAPEPEKSSPGPCNTRSMSYSSVEEALAAEDAIDWEDEDEREEHFGRLEATMAEDRTADAPRLTGDDAIDPGGVVGDAQLAAFLAGVPRWWMVVPPAPYLGNGRWHLADEDEDAGEDGDAAGSSFGTAAAPAR